MSFTYDTLCQLMQLVDKNQTEMSELQYLQMCNLLKSVNDVQFSTAGVESTLQIMFQNDLILERINVLEENLQNLEENINYRRERGKSMSQKILQLEKEIENRQELSERLNEQVGLLQLVMEY
tara:strand:+ start:210 stop:578 length:369 start_codon:yes stop_codon:yes gene_type:complete